MGITIFAYQMDVQKSLFHLYSGKFKLQVLFDVAVTVELTDNFVQWKCYLFEHKSKHGGLNIPSEVEKFMENKMSEVSTLYILVLVNYDWYLALTLVNFILNSLHIN